MTNILSFLNNISPAYAHTAIVAMVIAGLFVAVAILRRLAAWAKGPRRLSAYAAPQSAKLSRGARKSLARDGIKPQISKYNNTYRGTRNRTGW